MHKESENEIEKAISHIKGSNIYRKQSVCIGNVNVGKRERLSEGSVDVRNIYLRSASFKMVTILWRTQAVRSGLADVGPLSPFAPTEVLENEVYIFKQVCLRRPCLCM